MNATVSLKTIIVFMMIALRSISAFNFIEPSVSLGRQYWCDEFVQLMNVSNKNDNVSRRIFPAKKDEGRMKSYNISHPT
jgi:hypothetical protein